MEVLQAHLNEVAAYPNPDYARLRASLAEWHQLPQDWILPGNGVAELLTWAAWDLAQQSAVAVVTPAFADYERALNAAGARIERHGLDLPASADRAIAVALPVPEPDAGDRGLLLNVPHNPTGKCFSPQAIRAHLEAGSLVVVDEAFMEFLAPAQQPTLVPWLAHYPNLVVLRSLTKFYSLPGLRLGYALGHPERLRRWQQWRDPWPVNGLADVAGQAAVGDVAFQQQTRTELAAARDGLHRGLAAIPGLEPLASAANFVLVRTQQPGSELQARLLRRHRIAIRDCLSFPELGDRFFRVAVRSPSDNQRLLDGLTEVTA